MSILLILLLNLAVGACIGLTRDRRIPSPHVLHRFPGNAGSRVPGAEFFRVSYLRNPGCSDILQRGKP